MSAVVVIPTYNERANIEALIKKIFSLKIPGVKLVVVDDASPDGTADVARAFGRQFPVHVIEREKKLGLGTAYADVFRAILAGRVFGGEAPDFIVQMDADLSHDPAAVPRLLEAAQAADLVIGSRYIPGGTIENWGLLRRALSFLANIYARGVLALPYRDLTAGFKCYRRSALAAIDWNSISSVGYNFQIETVYRAHCAGLAIREIPITFTERKRGASKMAVGIILESFWKVLKLGVSDRLRKLRLFS